MKTLHPINPIQPKTRQMLDEKPNDRSLLPSPMMRLGDVWLRLARSPHPPYTKVPNLKFHLNGALLTGGIAILSMLVASPARASTIELEVLAALQPTPGEGMRCPDKVSLTQTARPYREGGYTLDGVANLKAIADNFEIASSDDFSVVWVGQLKPVYRRCQATAGIVKIDGEDYRGHSYLRMRFMHGKAFLILDMTGMRDANNYTTVILHQSVKGGNPTWSWGGTD